MPCQRTLPLLLLSVALLNSCATTSLWNGTSEAVYDERDEAYNLRPEAATTGELVVKVVLTPFAFAFDVLTSPVQALLVEGDAEPLADLITGDDD